MANEEYDFDDFDSDVAEAAKAEIAEEDAEPAPEVEEELEEDFDSEEEEEAPAPVAPVKKSNTQAPVRKAQAKVPVAPISSRPNPVQRANPANGKANLPRFVGVSLPKEYGIYDTRTGGYYKKDADIMVLILSMVADIKNDLEEVKKSL